ncbi:cathepsin W isoform X2 [Mastomys coucha]|uniref:cathepsin W isoform X2 n=1 Tax=Mastomys coucha TaxID=35658 RepID=UPI00126170F1|nr:cathepsin W isoform X2 [Mastomys coucha]
MTLTAHLSYFLALLLAGQGLSDSLLTKDAGPRPLELKEVFKLFQIQFNRSYSNPAEYTRRLGIFAHNLAQAQWLQREDLGSAEFGETPFSDLTEEEFGQLYGHQRALERIPNMAKKVESENWGESVPQTCDWRKATNIISSIKNQGHQKPHKCLAKKYKKVAWIQDFTMLSSNEQAIARYLAIHGPITVTINMKLLQHYQKGVIKATPSSCDPRLVDHSVLLVGFGKEKGGMQTGTVLPHSSKPRRSIPFWILKNSWGAQWGEKGYFRLYRGNNTCGITKYPVTALVSPPAKKPPISCPP